LKQEFTTEKPEVIKNTYMSIKNSYSRLTCQKENKKDCQEKNKQ
jgi:hypothetical protein